jgi:hypothetical protein
LVFDISNMASNTKESETAEKIELEPSTPPDPKHDQLKLKNMHTYLNLYNNNLQSLNQKIMDR